MSPPSVILLAGAPPVSAVDEASCTLDRFDDTFNRFMGLESDKNAGEPNPTSSHATWRSLPLARQPLHSGLSQTHEVSDDTLYGRRTHFFTTGGVSFDAEDESAGLDAGNAQELLTQFCEQSLAAHHSISSSQLDGFDTSTPDEASCDTTTSTNATSTGPAAPTPIAAHLSDLEDIPPAPRIVALNPQTVTLNLIVGIISIAQPRSVTTSWGKAMSLVEFLVGDDTASGFGVTFWLSADRATGGHVESLRRQDVVLMRNVALHVFRGKVYGQSLRRDMTKVDLLWRRDGGGFYSARALAKSGAASHPQLEKTRQVKEWVLKFVGGAPRARARATAASWDRPPDDTQ